MTLSFTLQISDIDIEVTPEFLAIFRMKMEGSLQFVIFIAVDGYIISVFLSTEMVNWSPVDVLLVSSELGILSSKVQQRQPETSTYKLVVLLCLYSKQLKTTSFRIDYFLRHGSLSAFETPIDLWCTTLWHSHAGFSRQAKHECIFRHAVTCLP